MGARTVAVNFCALLVCGVGHAEPRRLETPEMPATMPAAFVALRFQNQSGVAGLDWLEAALPFALAEKLEAHPGLRSVGGPLEVGTSPTSGGAALVFSGRFVRPNWRLEMTISLSRNGEIVGEETRRGDFSDAFEMLEAAAAALLAKAELPVPEAAAARFRRRPTRDFYAFTLFGRGLDALLSKDAAGAVKSIERSVFIDPRLAEAHRVLGVAYAALGQPGKARGQLSYAFDLNPDGFWPVALQARAARGAKDRDEAIDLAARALALRPWDLEMRYLLGELLWEDGDEAGAGRELGRVVTVAPDHVAARRILVLVHASQGNLDDLVAELQTIVEIDPTDVDARVDLGAALAALGREPEAIATYQAVIATHPRHLQALKLLGDLHKQRGELAAAISCYERAQRANRNDPRPYFLLGSAYLSAGQPDKALRVYLQAQRFARYLPETYSNLGALYYQKGRNEEAIWYLKAASAARPHNPRIHYNYGLALARASVRDKALEQFLRAVALSPDDAELHYALGVAYLRLGQVEEAQKSFDEALKLDPDHEGAKQNLHALDELSRKAADGEIQIE